MALYESIVCFSLHLGCESPSSDFFFLAEGTLKSVSPVEDGVEDEPSGGAGHAHHELLAGVVHPCLLPEALVDGREERVGVRRRGQLETGYSL